MEPARILIVGGGYAGVHAAHAASRTLQSADGGAEVLLVDSAGRHEFQPRLATVAAGGAGPGDAWADLGSLVGCGVVVDQLVAVDRDRRRAHLASGRELGYDVLVIAVGAQASRPPIPGLGDWTHPLKQATDALRIAADLPDIGRLVVVGGGATGVQLAGEAAAAFPGLEIDLAELENGILPGFSAALAESAAELLSGRGVGIRTGAAVAEFDADGARFEDGSRFDGYVVWAGGFAPHAHELLPDLTASKGRIEVDRYLRAVDDARIFIAGDAAAHRDAAGNELEMSAQVATQAGRGAGDNAARTILDRPPRVVSVKDRGWVVPLGGGRGVAELAGFELTGETQQRFVPGLHTLVDVRHLMQVGGVSALRRYGPGRHKPTVHMTAMVRRDQAGRREAAARTAESPPGTD